MREISSLFKPPAFIINFHGIGEAQRAVDVSERPYWVSVDQFKEVIDFLTEIREHAGIAITFDDGNVSDLEVAAPILTLAGWPFMSFVLAGRVGQKGYLDYARMRELQNMNCNIGLHGMQHRDWTLLNDEEMHEETSVARKLLEDSLGRRINSVAVPFGKYNRRVLRILAHSGFERIFTSDRGVRLFDGVVQPRYSVTNQSSPRSIGVYIEASRRLRARLVSEARFWSKSCL
ncbi:polysaccharide deacetylase family protein [Parvibaculum sp.]|uniref:polysaccharide deacetylase family protein n=1 Tax=Parvibaculum sp. TaxID=2024848 RepID=UPI001DBCBD35|nr:polysaccharide deacetylase family protein [Parvibaculum sp.]MBX3489212.1 polysaccharide deacetylase family protein [Parvibaculum sp.]